MHTTEFNLDSDDSTVSSGPTVAFRRRDIGALLERVAQGGHSPEPFMVGDRHGVLDKVIDVPPYHYSSLLLRLGRYRITSAVIILKASTTGAVAQEP